MLCAAVSETGIGAACALIGFVSHLFATFGMESS
jgi:hypothetical protein